MCQVWQFNVRLGVKDHVRVGEKNFRPNSSTNDPVPDRRGTSLGFSYEMGETTVL
jgi:hypothetical protein